jgi:hypothetical protein
MKRIGKNRVFVMLAAAVIALTVAGAALAVTPGMYLVDGNPNCANLYQATVLSGPGSDLLDLGPLFGFKYDANPTGNVSSTLEDNAPWVVTSGPQDPYNSVSIFNVVLSGSEGVQFDWSATLGIDAVIVKAQDANVYVYSPEAFGASGLIAPGNKAISHIEFCYDYEVDVSKVANTSFTRTYEWDITKSVDPAEWWMFAGDSGTSGYTVSVDKTGYTDSDWAVAGTITIENNTPFDATLTGVSDAISGYGPASIDCGVGFPYTLPAGQTLTCSYGADLPDGSNRTNTATVTTSGVVGGGEGTAVVTFGDPTTEVDKEISVTDTNGQSWGPVSGDTTWTYDKTFTCSSNPADYTDGHYMFPHDNTAEIVETGDWDDASVTVHCYAPVVSKDAHTSFTRTWAWTIDKSADHIELTLSLGQQFLVNYSVMVDATYTDSDWAVAGTITVQNPNPEAAMTVSLADVVSPDIVATLDCGGSLTVPAGGSATCGYSADLPDASQRLNTATATLNSIDFTGGADVIFGDPDEEIDECIDVSDTYAGGPQNVQVCYGDLPWTYLYNRLIGPYQTCGNYSVDNTASFVTNDTGTEGSDPWTVNVNVPCVGGCTLTQGYWKTHSEYGPAPYDDTWAMLPDGADTPFFGTGLSYYEVLWTVPKGGNAYFILAHQYIAAELNALNGAYVPSEVQSAMDQAEALLVGYEDKLSIPKKGGDRALAIQLYELLDDYNNGLIGPGHCSE